MELIKIDHFSFQYALSQDPALKDVCLAVDEGDFAVLFGRSGSGKSTLLRHLKPGLAPSGKKQGTIFYKGRDISALDVKKAACDIGMVLQNPDSQIVTDVVWHELAFGLENLGLETDIIRRRVAEMASFFGIGSWFYKKTDELSGGQKQILNLASILAMQPKLLLLDEPTAQLDPVAAREFLEMVSRLNREFGITVILSEHRLEDALPLANRAIIMESGSVKYCASPRALGSFLQSNKDYENYMPSAAKIFCRAEKDASNCPLTVLEGKKWLSDKINDKDRTLSEPAGDLKRNGGEPAIECRDLRFRYEKDRPDVIKGLSLKAFPGEICCILGENGAGKSTLLQLLAGILRPQGGRIFALGSDISKLKNRSLYTDALAFLPQNPKTLFLFDTVYEELLDTAQKTGKQDADERARQTAAQFKLSHLLGHHPYDLSGGEMQKAALAKIMLTRPKVLLLDEATKGLDPEIKTELAAILKDLCKKGVCALMITHDIEFAAEYADRCMLLFDGEISSQGTPRSFFGGNCFYTTAANRIARDYNKYAVTCGDVLKLCEN